MSPCGKEAAHGSPAQTAALERAQWQLCADAAGGPGQENEALCLSQVVSREGLRSGQEWAGRTAQVRALKEAQRALRFKLKPPLLQSDSPALSLLAFYPRPQSGRDCRLISWFPCVARRTGED